MDQQQEAVKDDVVATHEKLAEYLENMDKMTTELSGICHSDKMMEEMRNRNHRFHYLTEYQRMDHLKLINVHLQELLKERPILTSSDCELGQQQQYPRNALKDKEYPLYARLAAKAIQVIIGVAVIGLVLGPMKGNSYHDFVIRTNTEWQGLVIGISFSFSFYSLILGLTSCFASNLHIWKKFDGHFTAAGCFFWLLAGFVEAYYAACYPPNGPRINLVCHRAEWIIACVLSFINFLVFFVDCIHSWMNSVSMLSSK